MPVLPVGVRLRESHGRGILPRLCPGLVSRIGGRCSVPGKFPAGNNTDGILNKIEPVK